MNNKVSQASKNPIELEKVSDNKRPSKSKVLLSVIGVLLGILLLAGIYIWIVNDSNDSKEVTVQDFLVISADNKDTVVEDVQGLIDSGGLTDEEVRIARQAIASAHILNGNDKAALEQYQLLEDSVVLTYEEYISMAGIAERLEDSSLAIQYYTKALENIDSKDPQYVYLKPELEQVIAKLNNK